MENVVLAGVLMAFRSAARQGPNEDYLAGVLAQAEQVCVAALGDWPCVVNRAYGMLGTRERALLETVYQLGPGQIR